MMIQAEDRAHRLGQKEKTSVNCHYIYGEDTLDSLMFDQLEAKLAVVSDIIDGEASLHAEKQRRDIPDALKLPLDKFKNKAAKGMMEITSYFKPSANNSKSSENTRSNEESNSKPVFEFHSRCPKDTDMSREEVSMDEDSLYDIPKERNMKRESLPHDFDFEEEEKDAQIEAGDVYQARKTDCMEDNDDEEEVEEEEEDIDYSTLIAATNAARDLRKSEDTEVAMEEENIEVERPSAQQQDFEEESVSKAEISIKEPFVADECESRQMIDEDTTGRPQAEFIRTDQFEEENVFPEEKFEKNLPLQTNSATKAKESNKKRVNDDSVDLFENDDDFLDQFVETILQQSQALPNKPEEEPIEEEEKPVDDTPKAIPNVYIQDEEQQQLQLQFSAAKFRSINSESVSTSKDSDDFTFNRGTTERKKKPKATFLFVDEKPTKKIVENVVTNPLPLEEPKKNPEPSAGLEGLFDLYAFKRERPRSDQLRSYRTTQEAQSQARKLGDEENSLSRITKFPRSFGKTS